MNVPTPLSLEEATQLLQDTITQLYRGGFNIFVALDDPGRGTVYCVNAVRDKQTDTFSDICAYVNRQLDQPMGSLALEDILTQKAH